MFLNLSFIEFGPLPISFFFVFVPLTYWLINSFATCHLLVTSSIVTPSSDFSHTCFCNKWWQYKWKSKRLHKMFWAWIRRSPIFFFTISLKIYKDNILNFSNYLLRHQSLLYYHFCMCIEFFYTISSNLVENITYSTTLLTKVISSIQLWNVAMLNILKRSIAIHCFSSPPILMNELVAILFLIRSFMGGAGLCFFHAS